MNLVEVYQRRKLKVNVGKSGIMRCSCSLGQKPLKARLDEVEFEVLNEFKYLGSPVYANRGMEVKLDQFKDEEKMMGSLGYL